MQQASPDTDTALFRRLSAGDEEAFRYIFDRYKTKLYYFILHLLENEAAAEEVVQEVFMRTWTSRHKLAEVVNLDSYLFIMARNRGLDHIRKRAAEKAMQNEWAVKATAVENSSEEALDLKESRQLIEAAVQTLSPQQARIFRMSKEQGLKRHEIATTLGISENTVKNHLQEAIKAIKKYLQEHGDMALLFFLWAAF